MIDDLLRFLIKEGFSGETDSGLTRRLAYATDASVYREVPLAVIYPRTARDISIAVLTAKKFNSGLTIRAGGTSLAGQVVTSGIVADISRHMTRIIEINEAERWVRVQPGVILDELNRELLKHNLFFGPETSTGNRCAIGGMLGNNACGLHSLVYGSVRDYLVEVKAVMSDGTMATFGPETREDFLINCQSEGLTGRIYKGISDMLSDNVNAQTIRDGFPDSSVKRRNTGYALDVLLETVVFTPESGTQFNLAKVIAGSEGTLAIATEIKLALVTPPPSHRLLVCIHLASRQEAFKANLLALKHLPTAVEMMDKTILDLTRHNISQNANRFFIEGDPEAILIVEIAGDNDKEITTRSDSLAEDMRLNGYGFAYPVIKGKDISRVWELRKAGLGILSNMGGDAKPVSVIEDTAVSVEQLPAYMAEMELLLSQYGKESVFHAHIGTGELHVRPVLDLKNPEDVQLFRKLGEESAKLVRKYRGSVSGEHGDGRLRGEFIKIAIGEENYRLLCRFKELWDPGNLLNPGKITSAPPMDRFLRYTPGYITPEPDTFFDFGDSGGIIRAIERCNGSGDCRKRKDSGGTMCPSYMATLDEMLSTRARSNLLREFLGSDPLNIWDHKEVYDILDQCLSCKGCKSECPSNVDIATIKAEFLQHWYDIHGVPLRTRLIANISRINRIGSFLPGMYNKVISSHLFRSMSERLLGFSRSRSFPLLSGEGLYKWAIKNLDKLNPQVPVASLYLYIDEFTGYNDTETGKKAIRLLCRLGYRVMVAEQGESGRAYISKGLVRKAKRIAERNVMFYSSLRDTVPIVGIEPSAILSFRDEYPSLVAPQMREAARVLSARISMIDEFIHKEFEAGRIKSELFTKSEKEILVHGHCQQKALVTTRSTLGALSIPENFSVREIRSGCCGMAGSFGFEKEHYDLSMKIGELVLFPEIRKSEPGTLIAAPGTSCRQQIRDGTGATAQHTIDILWDALA